ncbi:hypothetical protein LEMLEM_LOCUS17617 [Lemmus lemmus]
MHPGLWLFLVSLCLTKELAEAVGYVSLFLVCIDQP